ncbi:NTP transferase domain-containing protein [Croceibacterium aestuarii]|uniref:NTP transferase domain-containing protein n=1 Tax=Croceibacterium aestuarii TaxID=3064139 RepID=UPI00272E2C63|nr:NTP transferase domain-containing protein [Croceibacterium sp. D39]
MSGLAIALLAAGGARRFGGGKLDADCNGRPLGAWALSVASDLEGALAVVVGSDRPAFAAGRQLVVNPHADEGLGTSAAAAARWAISIGADALLIMLADMPLVSSRTLRLLAEGALPSAARWPGDKPGAPACFPAAMFADLAVLQGEDGASRLLRGRGNVRLVDVDEDELRDVDRPEDLADVAAILARR